MAVFELPPRIQLDQSVAQDVQASRTTSGKAANSASSGTKKGQPWTEAEHLGFLAGLKKLGKGNWRGIARYFCPSRTPTQVASHAQKHFMRLNGVTKRKSRFSMLEQAACAQGLLADVQQVVVGTSGLPIPMAWCTPYASAGAYGYPFAQMVCTLPLVQGVQGVFPTAVPATTTAAPSQSKVQPSCSAPEDQRMAPLLSAAQLVSEEQQQQPEQPIKVCRPTAYHASARGVDMQKLQASLAVATGTAAKTVTLQPSTTSAFHAPSSTAIVV
jgi:SHAQKYF class myb-like DNA-binding protein